MKYPVFVAEISSNHLGSRSRAHKLVEAASEAGADYIKLQTYRPESMTLDLPKFSVSQNHTLWGGKNLFQLYQEAMTPWEWHKELFDHAKDLGVGIFSTPFDVLAVDFLEGIGCPIYKVASLETSDVDLISYVASKGKPLIISTGATTLEEIDLAVGAADQARSRLTLLVCTSAYPSKASEAQVSRILTLRERFGVEIGLSDHTLGIGVSIAAISLGATVIEKHLTLKRSDGGHDAAFSLEPNEFKFLVEEGKKAHESLGSPIWSIQASEAESRRLRRSLFITKKVKRGEVVTRDNVRALRPNTGGPIEALDFMLGRKFKSHYSPGDPATIECIE